MVEVYGLVGPSQLLLLAATTTRLNSPRGRDKDRVTDEDGVSGGYGARTGYGAGVGDSATDGHPGLLCVDLRPGPAARWSHVRSPLHLRFPASAVPNILHTPSSPQTPTVHGVHCFLSSMPLAGPSSGLLVTPAPDYLPGGAAPSVVPLTMD